MAQRCALSAPAASPYQGLRPYEEADAALFFGREAEGENVEANLFSDRLTLLYGPSGVGKSSVLLAGVAGSLRQRSRDDLADGAAAGFAVIVVRSWSDADPLQTIAAATRAEVTALLDRDDLPDPPAGATLAEVLDHWCGEVRGKLLLLFDQFEEYFLYHGQESGPGTFDREFPQAVNRADLRANFLLSIRDDALAQLDRFKGRIPGLFDNRLQIDHLGLDCCPRRRDAADQGVQPPRPARPCGRDRRRTRGRRPRPGADGPRLARVPRCGSVARSRGRRRAGRDADPPGRADGPLGERGRARLTDATRGDPPATSAEPRNSSAIASTSE